MSKNKVVIIISLFVTILFMAVGFSVLETSLLINGTSAVKSSTWNVHFSNLNLGDKVGEASEITAPALSSTNLTSISDYSVSLRKIDDSISYTFDVVNDGNYNAKISSINISTPTCSGTGINASNDATNVCKYLTYILEYNDGTLVKKNDTLETGQTKKMKLTLHYGSNEITSSLLAKSDVSISNLNITIIYSQI